MDGYFIRIGEKTIGPFLTEGAANAERKALKDKGYEVKVIRRGISDADMFEHLGHPEAEVEEEAEIDFDALFADDDDDEGDDDDGDDEGDDDDDDDDDKDDDDDDDDEGDDDDDDEPKGVHGWFEWGSKGKG